MSPSVDKFLSKLKNVRKSGGGWTARCPVPSHGRERGDLHNSLSITLQSGKVLLKCHAGCTYEEIVAALGPNMNARCGKKAPQRIEALRGEDYEYWQRRGVNRETLDRVGVGRTAGGYFLVKCGDLQYYWRDSKHKGKGVRCFWQPKGKGSRLLFPQAIESAKGEGEVLIVAEGLSDLLLLLSHGFHAVGIAGADAWRHDFKTHFEGFDLGSIVLALDNGNEGSARRIASELRGARILDWNDLREELPREFDICDLWKESGNDFPRVLSELLGLAKPAELDGLDSCWDLAKPAPDFLAEREKDFEGLAKDLLAPGAITLVAAPRGIGKSLFAHALAVSLATGGRFRGEQVQAVRVLLLDRDNPTSITRCRLSAWGAGAAPELYVLTRQDAPDLKDRKAWLEFPVKKYDVLIIDSVGSATEGVTEREGKQTTEVLATILDLARQGLAVLLLSNTTKDGMNLRGRGEWSDRADIVYEVRDATSFAPSSKKPWWQELPEAGEKAWGERADRRKGRTDFRLAFIPSKFRIGPEPDPFCLELRLEGERWKLTDVTADITQAEKGVRVLGEQRRRAQLRDAADALAEMVRVHANGDKPILKTKAEQFLQGKGLTQRAARGIITDGIGERWEIKQLKGGRGKGSPKALIPVGGKENRGQSKEETERCDETVVSETGYSVIASQRGDKVNVSPELATEGPFRIGGTSLLLPDETTEKSTVKTVFDGYSKGGDNFVNDEIGEEDCLVCKVFRERGDRRGCYEHYPEPEMGCVRV